MKIKIKLFVILVLCFSIQAYAQVTTLVCNFEQGGYSGTVKIDMQKKMLTETNELRKVIAENLGRKYDPEKDFMAYPIAHVSDTLIRTEKINDMEIEIDRRSLRMRWIRSVPPEWIFHCVKADKAF